jgi:Flp pilus assembly protein TadG
MWRISEHDRDDRGVVTLFVIGAIGIFLIAAACAVDVGRHVTESWSAQNSADAAVLAVATDCARTGSPIASYSEYYKPDDGQTINTPACGSGETTITVTKPVSGGLLLDRDARTMERSATAKWGILTGSTGTFPISVAYCAVESLVYGQKVTLHSYDTPGCTTGQGQFGWIAAGCSSDTSAVVGGDPLPGTTGNNPVGTGCGPGPDYSGPGGGKDLCVNDSSPPDCFLGTEVLVPVWDTADHQFPGDYPIIGYAAFLLTGWSDNGGNHGGTLDKQCDASGDGGVDEHVNKPCIRGTFVKFVTQTGTTGGPGSNFGAQLVYLSS